MNRQGDGSRVSHSAAQPPPFFAMNTEFSNLDLLLYWIAEREHVRTRREAGAPPPWSTDPLLATYRFCNANVQDDRVSRAIFDTFTRPYANHPGLVVALAVCRFTNAPEVFEAVRDCLVPFDPQRFVAIMEDRAARRLPLERRAYVIPGGRPGELKAKSLNSRSVHSARECNRIHSPTAWRYMRASVQTSATVSIS